MSRYVVRDTKTEQIQGNSLCFILIFFLALN